MTEDAKREPDWTTRTMLVMASGFLLFTATMYWRTLLTNFVYDDWFVLDDLQNAGILNTLLQHVDPVGAIVFRPLAWFYFAVMFGLFGLNPLPFHLVALLLQALNGTIVAWIGARISGKKLAGVLAGGVFIAHSSLHLDCFLWCVGIYDVGAMTCALLSMVFLMQGRARWSAAAMASAFLMKEAVVFLPLLLLFWVLLANRPLRDLTYHGVVTGAYVCVKLLGASPFVTPRDSGHAMELSGSVLLGRTSEYLSWLATAFLPVLESSPLDYIVPILVLLLLCMWGIARYRLERRVPPTIVFFLLGWIVLALMPVLLLKNQSARYYSVHALVPVVILTAIMLSEITARLSRNGKAAAAMFVLASIAIANAWHVESMFSQGLRQVIINDGYFHLIKRTAAVEAIYDTLQHCPQGVPHGATVFIDGVPLDAVGGNRAVRLWFRDTTLHVQAGRPPLAPDSMRGPGSERGSVVFIDLREASQPVLR